MSSLNLKKKFQSRDNIEITIIDSGLGGIIFSESFKRSNLDFNVITLIDKEGFPYGNKDLLWLKTRVVKLVCECKSELVLLACNTLSSIIYNDYIKFDKKVVDVITPTIYFFRENNFKRICILATTNTIKIDVYGRLLNNIYYIDATDLIYCLEKELDYSVELDKIVEKIDNFTDALLLGCTHLIAIKSPIRKKVGIFVVSQEEILINMLKKSFSYKK